MKRLLSRWRFELTALTLAVALAITHQAWVGTPVAGFGHVLQEGESAGLAHTFLRGIHSAEGRLTDLQFRLRGPRKPHPDVLVVEIDERSAKRYGLWPWSRALVAEGIRKLHDAGAAAIGLDMTFTEEVPDAAGETVRSALRELDVVAGSAEASGSGSGSGSGDATLLAAYRHRLESLRGPAPDAVLAGVIRSAPEVVQGLVMYNEASLGEMGPAAAVHRERIRKFLTTSLAGRTPGSTVEGVPLERVGMLRFHLAETPLLPFVEAGARAGFFNIVPDPDGTIRRMPPLARLDAVNGVLVSLELETAAAYHGTRAELVYDRNLDQVTSARLRARDGRILTVPLQLGEPYTFINHLGDHSVFKTLSFADVVDGKFEPSEVKGKAVLIGVTQVANFDQRVTPFSEFEPGVFTHASFLSNILDQSFLERPAELSLIELAFILGSALALGLLLPRVKFRWKLVVIALALGGWLVFDQAMFSNGLHFATFLPSVNVLATSFAVIFLSYRSADTERQNLAKAFQYRVGEKVMREMMAHPEKFKQGGERREMTVLFSDIRGFTSIAERMSPEELTKFINEYLTPMTEIVFEEDGTLDKYIGDAVMAFWGAPTGQQDHAARACSAALKMVKRLETLKAEWRARGRPDFDIGVGINSGPMSVGFMGSTIRGDYTVMGDAVNLASRLEGTNKEYETRILISEGTLTQVKDRFVARRLGAVRVKGKRRPVGIYELRDFGQPEGAEAEAIAAFEEALAAYSDRRFDEAERGFRRVLALWPDDPPSLRYLEEIAVFEESPPGPGWDGVYTATTK